MHRSGWGSASAATSPPQGRTPTTRSSGSGETPGSPTSVTARSPSSNSASKSPPAWSLNATNILAQKYFRGNLGSAGARVVAATGGRPGRRHHQRVGHQGRLLRRRRRGRGVQRRAEAPRHQPEGGVQLAGLVQHRRQGHAAAGVGVLHPLGRRHDEVDPQLVRRGGHDLPGRFRVGHQPQPHPLVRRAAQGRRHRVGPGELHARRRRVGRHHQERRQDAPRRQDGHPQRRPSRRRRLHLVQGDRGAQGPRAARRRLRHGPRRQGQPLHPVPERQQLGAGHRRVHGGGGRRRRLGSQGGHHGETVAHRQGQGAVPPDRRRRVAVRRSRACSSTPRSTSGTPRPTPAASTPATRARSTCTSTTRRATWRRSTCSSSSTTTAASTSSGFKAAVEVVFTAQEILVGNADYPTKSIAKTSREFRQLGPRLRQPRRAAHGPGPAVRLRRGSGVGRCHHRADDRSRLRHVGPHRRPHGPVRRLQPRTRST